VASALAVAVRIVAVAEGTRVTAFADEETIPLGQAQVAGPRLLARLRDRATRTQVATWRVSCVGKEPHTLSFDGAPTQARVDFDPNAWPLDVARTYVEDGRVVAEGKFCWGDDAGRAVATFAPGGERVTAAFASSARASFPAPNAEFAQVTFQDTTQRRTATRSIEGRRAPSRWAWFAAACAAVLLTGLVGRSALARRKR
jgi:hypothetical protein